jgi:hypothetical protein
MDDTVKVIDEPKPTTGTPKAGQIARVRQRLYVVESTIAPPGSGDSMLVSLSCVEDDG